MIDIDMREYSGLGALFGPADWMLGLKRDETTGDQVRRNQKIKIVNELDSNCPTWAYGLY